MAVAGGRLDAAASDAWFATALGRRVGADEERSLLEVLRPAGRPPAAGWRVLDAG